MVILFRVDNLLNNYTQFLNCQIAFVHTDMYIHFNKKRTFRMKQGLMDLKIEQRDCLYFEEVNFCERILWEQ